MSVKTIVRYCAPTLAGIKIGNLFGHRYDDESSLIEAVMTNNKMLNHKGVYFAILKVENGRALIYVYRKKALEDKLNDTRIQSFLKLYGYMSFDLAPCLDVLRQHLKASEFPHEIGIFLGYPLGDVIGFIENQGENCHCCGCWKAYTDIDYAKKTFDLYKKCTELYCVKASEGKDIKKLTVKDIQREEKLEKISKKY